MLDVLEVQDKLKSFSSYQLVQEMQMPTGRIPQFLVLSELNRRKDMKQDMARRESADQPTVKEEVVAASGMPMQETSMLAQQMSPQTSMAENTGIASMMSRELPSEEEPMRMSYGGMLKGSRRIMPRPGLGREVTDMRQDLQNRFPFPAMQGRFSSGLSNLGRDISGRVQNRTQEEVDDFIGEVDNMAQERFEVNLSEPSQRQRDMQSFLSGKGQPDPRTIKTTTAIPFAMKDGGVIKAQNGMFADIAGGLGGIDNTSGVNLPSFASIYNWIKTNFPKMPDADARRQAKSIQEDQKSGKIPTLDTTIKPFGDVEGRYKGSNALAQRKALENFSPRELNKYIPKKATAPSIANVQNVGENVDLDLTQVNPLFSAKPFGSADQRMSGINNLLAQRKALDNFTGGAEMNDLIQSLGQADQPVKVDPSLSMNPLFGMAFGDTSQRYAGNDALAQRRAIDNFTGGAEMSDLVDSLDFSPTNDPKEILARQGLSSDFKEPRKFVSTMLDPLGTSFKNTDFLRSDNVTNAEKGKSVGASVGATSDPLIYDPTIYGESQAELDAQDYLLNKLTPPEVPMLEHGFKPKTRIGKAGEFLFDTATFLGNIPGYGAKGVLKGGAGAVNYLRTPLKEDGTPFTDAEIEASLAQYVGLPSSMVDEFNKEIKEKTDAEERASKPDITELKEGVTIDAPPKKSEAGGTGTGTGGVGGVGGVGGAGGALSELEAEIDKLRADRKKGRESDKWFALAEVGLGIMASKSPTLAGAVGEGGLKGLKSFREGKKEYDKDMLGYLTAKASIQKTRGDQALKAAYYKGVLENAKKKGLTGLTSKEVLASRDRQLSRRADLIKDPTILMDYNNFIASGGKEPASGAVLELLRLDANIKKLENMLGSGFATVELDTVN